MTMCRLLPLALSCLLAADPTGDGAAGGERDRLQGTWVLTAGVRDGKPADGLKGHLLVIEGERFTIRLKGKVLYGGTVRVYPDRRPPAIDFMHTEGDFKGKTWLGIYRLDGDRLRVCDNAYAPDGGRPTEFTSPPGSGRVLADFERQKK